jgi:hypothetical protein
MADGTILVAEAGRTRSGALRQAVEGLSRATDRLLGVVLNKMGRRWAPGYYHRHHYYYSDESSAKARSALARVSPVGLLARGESRSRWATTATPATGRCRLSLSQFGAAK